MRRVTVSKARHELTPSERENDSLFPTVDFNLCLLESEVIVRPVLRLHLLFSFYAFMELDKIAKAFLETLLNCPQGLVIYGKVAGLDTRQKEFLKTSGFKRRCTIARGWRRTASLQTSAIIVSPS